MQPMNRITMVVLSYSDVLTIDAFLNRPSKRLAHLKRVQLTIPLKPLVQKIIATNVRGPLSPRTFSNLAETFN